MQIAGGLEYIPISAIALAAIVIVAGRAALAGNPIGLVLLGLAGLAAVAIAIAIGRFALVDQNGLAAIAALAAMAVGVILLAGVAGLLRGRGAPSAALLLALLAVVISGAAFPWAFQGESSICPAILPAGLPAGLTWTTQDKDVCISTDTGIRRIYHWSGEGHERGLVWSPDGQTLAVQDFPEVEFVSISGGIPETAEQEPQWYTDRPRRGVLEDPVLSPNGAYVAVYRDRALFLGASGAQARLQYITDGPGNLAWSPDSLWLAFDKPRVGGSEVGRVFVVRSDGTSLTEVAILAGSPVWRP